MHSMARPEGFEPQALGLFQFTQSFFSACATAGTFSTHRNPRPTRGPGHRSPSGTFPPAVPGPRRIMAGLSAFPFARACAPASPLASRRGGRRFHVLRAEEHQGLRHARGDRELARGGRVKRWFHPFPAWRASPSTHPGGRQSGPASRSWRAAHPGPVAQEPQNAHLIHYQYCSYCVLCLIAIHKHNDNASYGQILSPHQAGEGPGRTRRLTIQHNLLYCILCISFG